MNKNQIKISGEVKREFKEISPPKHLSFSYFPNQTNYKEMNMFLANMFNDLNLKNLDGQTKEESAVETSSNNDLDFYISDNALNRMFNHCAEMAGKKLEAMGFLIGEIRQWKNNNFSIVHDVVTSDLESTSISVRFRRDAFEDLCDQLDEIPYDYVLVGWYHSHPGFSSFMSHVDVDTQARMFNKPFHAAIVIDPISLELKSFRLSENRCIEISYAVFTESKEENFKIPVKTNQIQCDSCGQIFNVRNEQFNNRFQCPNCNEIKEKKKSFFEILK